MCDMAECPANYYNLISNMWSSGLTGNVDEKHKRQDFYFILLLFFGLNREMTAVVGACLFIY